MWVPGVNNRGGFGRWTSAEFTEMYEFESAFNDLVERAIAQAADAAVGEIAWQPTPGTSGAN